MKWALVGPAFLMMATVANASDGLYISGTSDTNVVLATTRGDGNSFLTTQTYDGLAAANQIKIDIEGGLNGGPSTPARMDFTPISSLQFGSLVQYGDTNAIDLSIKGSSNLFAVAQTGSSNSLTSYISGNYNQTAVQQIGNGNFASISQIGDGNTLTIIQHAR